MTTQCSTGKWITPVAGIVGALIVAATAAVSTQGGAPRYAADPSTQDPKREVDAGTPGRGPRRAWCARGGGGRGPRRAWCARGGGVEPMGAREAAVVPTLAFVELAQQHQQFVGGGVEARGQGRNGLAEVVGVGSAREHERVWRDVANG